MSELSEHEDAPEEPPVAAADPADEKPRKGRFKRMLLPIVMRYGLLRRGIGIHTIYRNTGGGLITAGLAYSALFALIPAIVLIIAGLHLLIDDPTVRDEAIEIIDRTFPALQGVTRPAVESTREFAALGSLIAIGSFAWAASGLYLQLTRAMERFFPGERVSGILARVLGIVLVLLVIVGVVAAVIVAGFLTILANALDIDSTWLLTLVGGIVTLVLATGLAYAIYRVMPASPPSPHGARLPAVLVGAVIGVMTLFYGFISPWLVSGYQMFGVMAAVFVALVWLRLVFMAMIYGAAMAKYRDHVSLLASEGIADPDAAATQELLRAEAARAAGGTQAAASAAEISDAEDAAADADDAAPADDAAAAVTTTEKPSAADQVG